MLVLAIVALLVPLGVSLRNRVDAEVRLQARSEAQVVAAKASGLVDPALPARLGQLVARASRASHGRVLIVDAAGVLRADSAGSGALGAPYAGSGRPEIQTALSKGTIAQEQRYSTTLHADILVTAVPISADGRSVGAVRVTQSVAAVHKAVRRTWLGLGVIALLVLGLGLLVGELLAHRLTRPILALNETAGAVAGGDLDARAPVTGTVEQRRLARTFNGMTRQLSRMIGAQRDFVADASHQLRTPLAGLRLRIESARMQTSDPAQQDDLDAALAEVDRLSAIVTELLELSRADAEARSSEHTDLDIVLGRIAERWEGPATEAGCALVIEGGQPVVPVTIGAPDVDRVLDVLIENAIAYAPGTTISISARGASIHVSDEGPGIPDAELDAVFDRFHRGSAGRAGPPGTGLGLAIARELARRSGGDLELGPSPDGGLMATMRLPAAPTT